MGFLADPLAFKARYPRIAARELRWEPPWPPDSRNSFWELYLGNTVLDAVAGDKAWKAMVPLHLPEAAQVGTLAAPVRRLAIEGFGYPHAIGVSATVFLEGDWSLDEAVEAAFAARKARYELTSPVASPRATLEDIARQALNGLREDMRGTPAPPLSVLGAPFSVATAVNGSVAAPPAAPPPHGDVHRALEGLCRWHPLWRQNRLHPMDGETCLKFKDKLFSRPDHVLYGLERGRSVWFPGYFGGAPRRTLGCYHRNLVMASLQTEALLALVRLAMGFIDRRQVMIPSLELLARNAAGALGRLYGGSKETYRSRSLWLQIRDSGLIPAIERLRGYFGMSPEALTLPGGP